MNIRIDESWKVVMNQWMKEFDDQLFVCGILEDWMNEWMIERMSELLNEWMNE